MVHGINKMFILNLVIALTGCFVVFLVHQLGYEWYMSHFQSRSRGATLGFVMFYMKHIVIPVVFISSFIKMKISLIIMILVFLFMFITWYDTNPLRVLLMFLSGATGYVFVILCLAVKNKIYNPC